MHHRSGKIRLGGCTHTHTHGVLITHKRTKGDSFSVMVYTAVVAKSRTHKKSKISETLSRNHKNDR